MYYLNKNINIYILLLATLGGIYSTFLITGCNSEKRLEKHILNKEEILNQQNWLDNKDWDWYKENIPFFESSDSDIDQIYYYRWELITKHLVYASPKTGYTFTEFMNRPSWSGAYGSISCPLGHQFYEIRWLKDPRVIRDFARYWFKTPGAEPRSYSNWYGDAMWSIFKVNQDKNFLENVYPFMKKQYNGFAKEHYNLEHGLFMWNGVRDGMEVNINSRLSDDRGLGYRPTLNSYMYADLKALSEASELLNHHKASENYTHKAIKLKKRVEKELWDPERHFFFHQFAFDQSNGISAYSRTYETGKYTGNPHGREEIGFIPWQFELPDTGYAGAWKYLMDKDYFFSKYGPTTTEKNDPQFHISDRCCVWSGQSWPFATTQTLVAMANLLQDYKQSIITKDDYVKLLKVYTKTQHKNGHPYIAEAANPFTGSWKGYDHYYHSENYFHSGYINNIITGLVGLRPRADDTLEVDPLIPDNWDYFALEDIAYHGHNISIIWDKDGSRYEKGKGLTLFIDGNKMVSSSTIKDLKVGIHSVTDNPLPPQPINFAVNNGQGYFPYISASYSSPKNMPYYANDGNYWYDKSPANRWTTEGSDHDQEWIEVNYGTKRPIKTIKLYFLDDGNGVVVPNNYRVQIWKDNKWVTVDNLRRIPEVPIGHRANVVTFDQIHFTSKIRVLMTPRDSQAVGLTEFETWGKAYFPLDIPTAQIKDLAYNKNGRGFPKISASYTDDGSQLRAVNDMKGLIPFNASSQWSAKNSTNEKDQVSIKFGPRKYISKINILFIANDSIDSALEDYYVEYWNGSHWKRVKNIQKHPKKPILMAINSISMTEPIFSNKIRLVFMHKLLSHIAINEIMVWAKK